MKKTKKQQIDEANERIRFLNEVLFEIPKTIEGHRQVIKDQEICIRVAEERMAGHKDDLIATYKSIPTFTRKRGKKEVV